MYITKYARCAVAIWAFALTAATMVIPASAQSPRGPKYASVSDSISPTAIAPGQGGKLVIFLTVAPGFHVNSVKPTDPSLIATTFAPASAAGLRFGPAKFPKAVMIKTAGSTEAIPVYMGAVRIIVPFTVAPSARAGSLTVGGTLTYQGCNSNSCYPPANDSISAKVVVK
jgi:hypothetical protein